MSRGSFIITQKENKGEYSSGWKWSETDIYAHVFDQNGKNGGDGTPYRYLSATSFGSNVCTGDTKTTNGKTIYSNINEQISCSPSTLNAGNYYSFPAATAGAPATTRTTLNSICPKGWRLPPNDGNKSYNYLIRDTSTYHITDTASDTNLLNNSAMSFVRMGDYAYNYGSLNRRGNNGRYWSSTAYSDTGSLRLDFHSGYLNPQNGGDRAYGFSVRCVSR